MSIVKQITNFAKNIKNIDVNYASKIANSLKHGSDFITAKTRDIITRAKSVDIKQRVYERLDQKTIRTNLKNAGQSALRINEHVVPFYNRTKKLIEGTKAGQAITKIASKPWAKRSLFIGGSVAALSLVEKAMTTFEPKPAIPEHYEKGYDVMKQTMTDFGSPVNLLKSASKTITPYYSTVRKSITTTTRTVTDRNIALFNSKNAIRHTRY